MTLYRMLCLAIAIAGEIRMHLLCGLLQMINICFEKIIIQKYSISGHRKWFICWHNLLKIGRKSVFLSKMAAQGQWFGLKTILIDSIGSYYISNNFSMNSNKFSRLTEPSGPSFRAQKCPKMPKNQYFPSKMAAQVQWFGLKPILIDSISGYCISNDFSMNSNKFSPLTRPSGP